MGFGNKISERGWSELVEAVEHRNSTEGMNQLELVGGPTVESDEESSEGSEDCEEESDKLGEECGESGDLDDDDH